MRALAGGPYLLGAFSYADIARATVLQGVTPVADRYLPLGPATRRVWTHDALAAEFADLVAWRDRWYSAHRAAARSRRAQRGFGRDRDSGCVAQERCPR